jgi:hypothetical protein
MAPLTKRFQILLSLVIGAPYSVECASYTLLPVLMAFLRICLAAAVRCLFRVTMVLHIRSSDATAILVSRAPRLQSFQLRVLQHCCDRLVLLSENVLNDFAAILGPGAPAVSGMASCPPRPRLSTKPTLRACVLH